MNATNKKKITHHGQAALVVDRQGWFNICKSKNVVYHRNGLMDRNHVINSVHIEKGFDKIQYPSMLKILGRAGIQGHT